MYLSPIATNPLREPLQEKHAYTFHVINFVPQMIGSSAAFSEHSIESDEFFPIKDTVHEIIVLYTSGDETAANIRLRELTDNIITASNKSIDELFSYECLRLIFNFVGDGAHELSLHLMSFLTIFSQNFHKLQEFSSSSTNNLNSFLKPLRHIDNQEILTTYSDFFRDLSFTQSPDLGYTILMHIITSMFSADSFSKVQNFGIVLKQLLSPHNIQIADFFLKYLNTYISENYSEIVGYGKLSAIELSDRLRSLEATLAFPRSEKQSICERLTILDEETAYMEQRSRTPSLACVPCPLPQSLQTSWGIINRTSRSCTPVLVVNSDSPRNYQQMQLRNDQCLDIHLAQDTAADLDDTAIDAFFTAVTCLMETLPLAFSLSMDIISMSNESMQQEERIDLTQDFEERRLSGSVDSTLSHGSSTFLVHKNEPCRKPSDARSSNRSISPFPAIVNCTKTFSPDTFFDKDEFKVQRPMMPPRHTDTKRYAENTTYTELRVCDAVRLSVDSNDSVSPTIQTPTGETAQPICLTETELTPTPDHSAKVQQRDDQTFQDLFNAHFMPSTVDDEVPAMPILETMSRSRSSGSDFQCAQFNQNIFQTIAHNSESDNPSFQMITIPNRTVINPCLMDQAQQYLQMIKIFIYRTALLLSDTAVSMFVKLKMLNLLLLLSNEAKEHRYKEFFTIMTESSCYDSIIHLSIKTEHGSVLHSLAYNLLTTAMSILKTFALNSSMMTAILHKIKLVYDTNLLYTGQKALQCRTFQEFVDYLSVNGLYPLRNRTSLISMYLGLVKYWIHTCCGYEFSFSGLFSQTHSTCASAQEAASTMDSSTPYAQGNFSGSRSATHATYDSAGPEADVLHRSSCYSNNTSMLPNFINFANPNNRCILVPIPGIVGDVSILLMKRFLSIFVLSTRTARYFYHMNPIQYYSTPTGRIVALNASLRASVPPPASASLVTSSPTIHSRQSGPDQSSDSPKPLATSITSALPHSIVLSSYMQKSVNWPGRSSLREEDLIDPYSISGEEESLETNISKTTSRYTDTEKKNPSQKIVTRYTIEVPQSPTRLSHLTDVHAGISGISLLESTSLLVASATGSSTTHSIVHDTSISASNKQPLGSEVLKGTLQTPDECEPLSDLSDSLVPEIVNQYKELSISPSVSVL